jgi:acyl-CoA thioesterase-2
MSMTEPNQESMAQLLRVLNIQQTGTDSFHAEIEHGGGRLFGGLVLAQSLMAAGRTTEGVTIHSLHAYFLRAGKSDVAIDFGVERIREGRNFQTRRVTAVQAGDTIFESSVSFTKLEDGLDHQQPMPLAPDPDSQPGWMFGRPGGAEHAQIPPEMRERMEQMHRTGRRGRWPNPIEIRSGETGPLPPLSERLPRRLVWGRSTETLPEDPLLHAAAMVYFSDSGMVGTVGMAYGTWGPGGAASLDHAMYWHSAPQFNDWLLYVTDSPVGRHARALTIGSMFNREGVQVASVVQEALFRGRKAPD